MKWMVRMWIFLVLVQIILTSVSPESSNQLDGETTLAPSLPESLEILKIVQPPGVGNAVKVIWGREFENFNLNATYGLHYGTEEENILAPRLITKNLSAIVEDLEYCTKYNFAVTVINDVNSGSVTINPNNIRSIITLIDPEARPKNLHVDYEPLEAPCLVIKWSASCPNVGHPIGYVISALQYKSTDYKIVTFPATKMVDFIYHFKVSYGEKYDIKVSTNFPGSKATDVITYIVPDFLQPHKVRIAANAEEGAFMIYWAEPFIPDYINKVYYEVSVHKGATMDGAYEKYFVTRPILIYKGDESQYTFTIGSVSYDEHYRSNFTTPLVADIYGEVYELQDMKKT